MIIYLSLKVEENLIFLNWRNIISKKERKKNLK